VKIVFTLKEVNGNKMLDCVTNIFFCRTQWGRVFFFVWCSQSYLHITQVLAKKVMFKFALGSKLYFAV